MHREIRYFNERMLLEESLLWTVFMGKSPQEKKYSKVLETAQEKYINREKVTVSASQKLDVLSNSELIRSLEID